MIVLILHHKTLRIAYNYSLRKLLGIPKYNNASEMFQFFNIPSFDELLRKYVYFFQKQTTEFVSLYSN